MNVALRELHERLGGSGDPAVVWRELVPHLVSSLRDGKLVAGDAQRVLAQAELRIGAGDWIAMLGDLGVVDRIGRFDEGAARDVGVALALVQDSFAVLGTVSTWTPVATVPPPLRPAIRAPVLRQTGGVLLELLEGARVSVRMAAPYVDGDAVRFLEDALLGCAARRVEVTVLTSLGSSAPFRGLLAHWPRPPSGRLVVVELETALSTLGSHAKVLVADGERAYVGSANLTAAGLGRHVELGVELAGDRVHDLNAVLQALSRLGTVALDTRAQ